MSKISYYDAPAETMPAAAREKYLNDKVSEIVRHAWDNAPAIKAKMAAAGVKPENIKTVADLPRIPLTRKNDLPELEKQDLPFGGFLGVPRSRRIYVSPGPIYEPEISDGQYHAAAKALYAAGFRKGEHAVVTVSFHMTPAGQHFAGAMQEMGVTVVPTGVGNTELQLQIMRDLKVTGYAGTPSFLMTLINKAEELGYDFGRDFYLKHALVGAEMLPESLRRTFEDKYSINTQQIFSTAELLLLGYECGEKSGWHVPEEVYIEIADPETGQPVAAGEIGEVVVTPFNPIFPLIRYAIGDLSRLNLEACPCGRSSPRLMGLLGRVGDAVKARGMFIHPNQVRLLLQKYPQVTAFQCKIGRSKERDTVTLTCEIKDETAGRDKLAADIIAAFPDICRVKLDGVDFVAPGSLPKEARPIMDLRTWD
jgi:phenylacetate-coenzyme A ligase PaaK-like adenylate-forming protein